MLLLLCDVVDEPDVPNLEISLKKRRAALKRALEEKHRNDADLYVFARICE